MTQLNPDTATLEELRKAAITEAEEESTPKAIEAAPEKKEEEEEERTVYRTEIDLGDGGGVQVFEATSAEELTEKLIEAQKHATKKIRQQETELKELRSKTAKPKNAEITQDQEYIWAQEIAKNPSKVIREIVRTVTGRELEDLKALGEKLDLSARAEQVNHALDTFLTSHEDYKDSDKNTAAMKLAIRGQEVTSENLHKAYLQLKADGLLDLKGSEADADATKKPEATERIAQPKVEAAQARTRGTTSGISSHGRPVARPAEPSEADLYKMPLEELREKANRQLSER